MYDASHPVLFGISTKELERRYAPASHDHAIPESGGWRAEKRRAELRAGKPSSRED